MNGTTQVVFSDLDGALLDDKTFEWTAARAVIDRLKQAGVPLVFVSSKTRAEIATLRAQMGNHDPFAAENGAVVVRPRLKDVVLGRPAVELEQAAQEIAAETGSRLELLSQMSRRRAMETTGLPECKLHPARERQYSAPFLLNHGDLKVLQKAAHKRALRIIPGRRLLQLVGDHDKGDAVHIIRQDYPNAVTIGIGDGPNDLPLLRAVDRPIFQGRKKPPRLPPNTYMEPRIGPSGWSRAVWAHLKSNQAKANPSPILGGAHA